MAIERAASPGLPIRFLFTSDLTAVSPDDRATHRKKLNKSHFVPKASAPRNRLLKLRLDISRSGQVMDGYRIRVRTLEGDWPAFESD